MPRDIVADDLVVGPAEVLHQDPLPGQVRRVRVGEPVGAHHVHSEQVGPGVAGGDPGRPADERVALRAAGQRDDDPFPGFPGGVDAVFAAVAVELLVDLFGQPEQRELAQRGEVADPEVVAQRGVDLVRRVHVAVRHPPPQRLRGDVDQLDLVGRSAPPRPAPSPAAAPR